MLMRAALCAAFVISACVALADEPKQPVEIGSRLELFVDDFLIDRTDGAERRLHHPVPQDVAITFDAPNEGNTSAYVTIFEDDGRYRMYFRGSDFDWSTRKVRHEFTCYAESEDGITWTRPELGLVEFEGSKANNILRKGAGSHNFTPFKDANPAATPQEKYKALAGDRKTGLIAYASADGIHWEPIREQPVITEGAFDSQNLAFWDAQREQYVGFHRHFADGVRGIMTSTSDDFLNWTEPRFIDMGNAEPQHLYTNATVAYHRAPHIYLAFPMRLVPDREAAFQPTPEHDMPGVCDGVLMSSRDGVHWNRWDEAFLRPGQNVHRWWQRNNYTAWGILETKSDLPDGRPELSLYATENYYTGPCKLRRFSLRIDGFASMSAPYAGGEFTTRPVIFSGDKLVLNVSTSAIGSVRCELQDAEGKPIEGYALDDCPEIYGDRLEHVVAWKNGADVSKLAGQPVRLRFAIKDADLYSLRFAE